MQSRLVQTCVAPTHLAYLAYLEAMKFNIKLDKFATQQSFELKFLKTDKIRNISLRNDKISAMPVQCMCCERILILG